MRHPQRIRPVRFEREGNPYYPLPPEYGCRCPAGTAKAKCKCIILTNPEDRRRARVNAISLQETAEDLVNAWRLTCHFYLRPQGEAWYATGMEPDAPIHHQFIYDIGRFPRNCFAWPRSFAKSTKARELLLTLHLGRWFFKSLVIVSTDSAVAEYSEPLRNQFTTNDLIIDDFGWMKSKVHEGSWSSRRMRLANQGTIVFATAKGQKLGKRPHIWILDDAEYDQETQIAPTYLTESVERMIVHHLEPMLDKGCAGVVLGTLFSRKMYIFRMANMSVKEDPKLVWWNRVIYSALDENFKPIWPEKFGLEELVERLDSLGAEAFAAQLMNAPGTDNEREFPLHPKLSGYEVMGPDASYVDNPLGSQASLVTHKLKYISEPHEANLERIVRPFGKTIQKMFRFITVDTARGSKTGRITAAHDFSAVMVLGREHNSTHTDTLYVLGLWIGRVKQTKLAEVVWSLSELWRAKIVAIEDIGQESTFKDYCARMMADRAERDGWHPRVIRVDYESEIRKPKGKRIGGLAPRFESWRIKIPLALENRQPWRSLIEQIRNFTESLALLEHDDAIDCLSMSQYVIGRKGAVSAPPDRELSDIDLMRKGILYHPKTKIFMPDAYNMSELPMDVADAIFEKTQKEEAAEQRRLTVRGGGLIHTHA